MATEQDELFDAMAGNLNAALTNSDDTVKKVLRRRTIWVDWLRAVTLTTNSALANSPVACLDAQNFPNGARVVEVQVVPATGVTAGNTDYGSVILTKEDGAAGTPATIWTGTTQTTAQANGMGNLVAKTVITKTPGSTTAPIDASTAACAAGSILLLEITKSTATGANLTGLMVGIVVEFL